MLNIMLIEDDDEDAFMIRRAIEKHVRDADCVRVQTLAAGERMLKENGADVVILDLHLPDSVNPADDCARIFKCAGKAPVVISTNTTDRVLANILVHAGAEDFLDKQ
ncbi:MAG: response regulator, partial [Alphaproteobacteria bacterium]|nr:response regulator [Alphaproteobacteria bacterium]